MSAATRGRPAFVSSSALLPHATIVALLALARVVDCGVVSTWPNDLPPTPWNWGANKPVITTNPAGLPWTSLITNDDVVPQSSTDFSDSTTWGTYIAYDTPHPWVQLDLGGKKIIKAIEIFGHGVESRCNLHLLDSFGTGCGGGGGALDPTRDSKYFPTLNGIHNPTLNAGEAWPGSFSSTGAKIGVAGPTDTTQPCVLSGACGGTVCATLETAEDVGFESVSGSIAPPGAESSIKVTWYAAPFDAAFRPFRARASNIRTFH